MHVYLKVPFKENDDVRRLGAVFDPDRRRWRVTGNDLAKHPALYHWVPEKDLARLLREAKRTGPLH